MVRVLVLYPRGEGKRFDLDYYKNRHMPLVKELLKPLSVEMDISLQRRGEPSPYLVVSHMTFESMEQLMEKYAAVGEELIADKLRFTDIETIFQVSEVISL